jgi:hypothetical protein
LLLVGVGTGVLVACAESTDESALPHDPDYVAGSAGMAAGGMAPTSGSGNVSGSAPKAGTSAVGGGGTSAAGSGGSGGAAGGTGGGAGGATGGAAGGGGADACPTDPDKSAPGTCGCGVPDTDSVKGAGCAPLKDAIIHRYSFDTNGNDSVGTAHGTLKNGATVAGKALTLSGGLNGGYLDLPNGLASALTNATFEAWLTWAGGGGDWQRIFDFGSSTAAEDQAGDGNKYLFLSARKLRTAYTSATPPAEVVADASAVLPAGTLTQLAVVVNDTENTLNLYLNGDSVGGATLNLPLSAINDVNNWLGRSQFAADEYFAGTISEFRIYDAALTGPQLKTAFKMGEDTTFLEK